jgi:hypothetical protein
MIRTTASKFLQITRPRLQQTEQPKTATCVSVIVGGVFVTAFGLAAIRSYENSELLADKRYALANPPGFSPPKSA